jgi:hypothetical protein
LKSTLIALCFLHCILGAQTSGRKPGKPNTPASVFALSKPVRDTCLDKKFSIVFYFPNDSLLSKTPASFAASTNGLISTLNNAFRKICVSFVACSTVIIPHWTFNTWRYPYTENVAMGGWYTPSTINLYLVAGLGMGPIYFEGLPYKENNCYAHAPNVWGAANSTKDIICSAWDPVVKDTANVLHAFGHYFGLTDTYAELGLPANPQPPVILNKLNINSNEFADESNCDVNGDLLCDTEADPFPAEYYIPPPPIGIVTYCRYHQDFGRRDGKGNFYDPPFDNYMSQYECRCKYTPQQYSVMARFILKNRMYLH